jgi:K+ transporter
MMRRDFASLTTRNQFESAKAQARLGKAKVVPLSLAALGVVFGDIGTSPLYAFKECRATAQRYPIFMEPSR